MPQEELGTESLPNAYTVAASPAASGMEVFVSPQPHAIQLFINTGIIENKMASEILPMFAAGAQSSESLPYFSSVFSELVADTPVHYLAFQ